MEVRRRQINVRTKRKLMEFPHKVPGRGKRILTRSGTHPRKNDTVGGFEGRNPLILFTKHADAKGFPGTKSW